VQILADNSVKVFARGPLLQPPALPLSMDSHLTVQLVTTGGSCIESVFDAADSRVIENDADVLQVRN